MYAQADIFTGHPDAATADQASAPAVGVDDRRVSLAKRIRQKHPNLADDQTRPLTHNLQAPAAARKVTAAFLEGCRVGEEAADAVLLVVSELVTNSVKHARPPLTLHLKYESGGRQLRVEVEDGGPSPAQNETPTPRETDENGRGMHIINALATVRGAQTQAHSVTHWATLPVSI